MLLDIFKSEEKGELKVSVKVQIISSRVTEIYAKDEDRIALLSKFSIFQNEFQIL